MGAATRRNHASCPSMPVAVGCKYFSSVLYRSPTASRSGQRRADQSRLFSSKRGFRVNVHQILTCQIWEYSFVNIHVKLLSSEVFFSQKCSKYRSAPGSARTSWESLQRCPRPPIWTKRAFTIPHPRCCFAKHCKNVASQMQVMYSV